MDCERLLFSGHAIRRMQERQTGLQGVLSVVQSGETILEWIDDGEPARLMLGFPQGRPLHVVLAWRDARKTCLVVPVYDPDPSEWTPDFKRKLRQ